MRRTVIVPLLIGCQFALGCHSSQHAHGGRMVGEVFPTLEPTTKRAPQTTEYTLFGWRDESKEKVRPGDVAVTAKLARNLKKGDLIGFRRGPGGELFAVAGTEDIPLADGRYCWHVTSKSLDVDPWTLFATGVCGLGVGAAAFGLGSLISEADPWFANDGSR